MEVRYATPTVNHPSRHVDISGTAVEWRTLATMLRTHKGCVGCRRGPHLAPWQRFLSSVQIELAPGHKVAFAVAADRTLLITGGAAELGAAADAMESLSRAIRASRDPDFRIRVEFRHEDHYVARESIPAVFTLVSERKRR